MPACVSDPRDCSMDGSDKDLPEMHRGEYSGESAATSSVRVNRERPLCVLYTVLPSPRQKLIPINRKETSLYQRAEWMVIGFRLPSTYGSVPRLLINSIDQETVSQFVQIFSESHRLQRQLYGAAAIYMSGDYSGLLRESGISVDLHMCLCVYMPVHVCLL